MIKRVWQVGRELLREHLVSSTRPDDPAAAEDDSHHNDDDFDYTADDTTVYS